MMQSDIYGNGASFRDEKSNSLSKKLNIEYFFEENVSTDGMHFIRRLVMCRD